MTGAELLPQADALQVHWLVFEILLIVTFLLHLLLMNVMLGGSIIAAVMGWRDRHEPEETHEIPITIALTVNFGVPPLLFVQVLFGHLFYTSSVLMGAFWLSVIPILIVAYYAAYLAVHYRKTQVSAVWSTVSAILLLVIGFLFVNNMTFMLDPGKWAGYFAEPGGVLLNLSEPTLIPRYLHFVVGALAVTGLAWAVWSWYREKRGGPPADKCIAWGLKVFWVTTLVQVAIGLWWVIALPEDVMKLFMGGSMYASALLLLGVLLTVGLVIMAVKGKLWPTVGSLVLTMLVMILMRDVVRGGYLSGIFTEADLAVNLSLSPLVLFLISFVVGLVVLGWMVKTALDPRERMEAEGGE